MYPSLHKYPRIQKAFYPTFYLNIPYLLNMSTEYIYLFIYLYMFNIYTKYMHLVLSFQSLVNPF